MRISARLLVLSTIVAFAPVANAGGVGEEQDEAAEVVIVEEGSSFSVPGALSLGSLGGGGAIVAGSLLALAIAAAASGSSGSH